MYLMVKSVFTHAHAVKPPKCAGFHLGMKNIHCDSFCFKWVKHFFITRSSRACPIWNRSSSVKLEYRERNFCSTPNWSPVQNYFIQGFLYSFLWLATLWNSPWLVLFNLLSKLDLSILDWTLTCGGKTMKCNKGLLTFGFFIPLVEADVAAEVSWSLLGGLEELQDPASSSCSRICLFLHAWSPDCKWKDSGNDSQEH